MAKKIKDKKSSEKVKQDKKPQPGKRKREFVDAPDDAEDKPAAENTDDKQTEQLDEIKEKLQSRLDRAKRYAEDNYHEDWKNFDSLFYGESAESKEDDDEREEWRANIFIRLGHALVMTELPRLLDSMYGSTDYWRIRPIHSGRGKIKIKDSEGKEIEVDVDNDASAKAMEEIIRCHRRTMGLYTQWYHCFENALKKGIGPFDLSWRKDVRTRKYFDERDSSVKVIEQDQTVYDAPDVESLQPEHVFWDPSPRPQYVWRQWDVPVWKIKQLHKDKKLIICINDGEEKVNVIPGEVDEWLESLDECDDYEIKSLYREYCEQPETTMAIMTEEGHLLHYTPYIYKHCKMPIFQFVKYPNQDDPYGMGSMEVTADIQEAVNSTVNLKFDNAILATLGIWTVDPDALNDISVEDLEIEPGVPLPVKPGSMERKTISGTGFEADKMLQDLLGFSNQVTGTSDYAMTPTANTKLNDTFGGMQIITAEGNKRYSVTIRLNKDTFIKFMYMLLELEQQFMDMDNAKILLGEKLAKDLQLESGDINLSAPMEFEVTGNDGIVDKENEINQMMYLFNLLSKIPGAVDMIDIQAFVKTIIAKFNIPDTILKAAGIDKSQVKTDPNASPAPAGDAKSQVIQEIGKALNMTPEQIDEYIKKGGKMEELMVQAKQALTAGTQPDAAAAAAKAV
jgi:hypothetical protein